jgi:uncharacterized protein YjbI with pentapeptide repeats
MKKLILISALLLLVASNGWAYSETDLLKLKQLNQCLRCDLSGANLSNATLGSADLRDTYLRGADLSGANLRSADLRGAYLTYADLGNAKYCKTKMPWGEVNDDCEDAD